MLQLVLKDDVYDVAVRLDQNTPLELHWIFDSATSDYLSCNRDMEEIILEE